LLVDAGKATYTLTTPAEPLPSLLRETVDNEVAAIFGARKALKRKSFQLRGPNIIQHTAAGTRNIAMTVGTGAYLVTGGQVDFVVTDAAGNVKADSKAERIVAETSFVRELAQKAAKSATLRAMLDSYGQATDDPDNELVHLYEIRDAASKHYGGEKAARDALGITKTNWQALGRLANDEPLVEGRHRGRQVGSLRNATEAELETARSVARSIIDGFAATV
jgi:hypothetical protein